MISAGSNADCLPSILLSLIVLIPCASMSFTPPVHDVAWRCSIMCTCCHGPEGKSGPLGVLFATNDIGRGRRSRLPRCVRQSRWRAPCPAISLLWVKRAVFTVGWSLPIYLDNRSLLCRPRLRESVIKQRRAQKASAHLIASR